MNINKLQVFGFYFLGHENAKPQEEIWKKNIKALTQNRFMKYKFFNFTSKTLQLMFLIKYICFCLAHNSPYKNKMQ